MMCPRLKVSSMCSYIVSETHGTKRSNHRMSKAQLVWADKLTSWVDKAHASSQATGIVYSQYLHLGINNLWMLICSLVTVSIPTHMLK
jgi:hypothetical protein